MKYAICYSLFDLNKISENSLYYYKGIINSLCLINIDIDIYVDTTEYCKNILLDIIKQEDLNTDRLFINIHPDEFGMFWRWQRAFSLKGYDIISIQDSDFVNSHLELLNDIRYGLFFIINTHNNEYVRCWSSSLYPGGNTSIREKYLCNDFSIYKYVLDKYCKIFHDKIYHGCDEELLNNLFIKDSLNNNVAIISAKKDINPQKYMRNFFYINKGYEHNKIKLKYLNDKLYKLNGIDLIYDDFLPCPHYRPKDIIEDKVLKTKIKFFMTDVQKYILNQEDNFSNYE